MKSIATAILTMVVFMQITDSSFAQGVLKGLEKSNKDNNDTAAPTKKSDKEKNSAVPAKPRKLTLDEEIDQAQELIKAAEEMVRAKRVKPMKNWKAIRKLADESRQTVEAIRKNLRKRGPSDAPEKIGVKRRFQNLDKTMSQATNRLQELEKTFGKLTPPPGGHAIREMSDRLFQVSLLGAQLTLEQLRWKRENKKTPLKIKIVNSKTSVDLYYEEPAPKQRKQRSGGGGLAGLTQRRVVDRFDNTNAGGGKLKATFHVDVDPWYDGNAITFAVKGDSIPSIDKKFDIETKVKLRNAARSFALLVQTHSPVLTIDQIEELREKRNIEIDVSKNVMSNHGPWKFKGKPYMIVRLTAER